MYVSAIPAEYVETVWSECAPLLRRAIEYANGEFDIDDVLGWLKNRDMQLWVAIDDKIVMACTTEVLDYPKKRVLRAILVGGDGMRDWIGDLDRALAEYAKQIGAKSIEAVGRKGWIRALGAHGWKENQVILSKEI